MGPRWGALRGTREVRGYAALEARVTGSHEKNVRDAGNHFRATTNARVLRDVVTFEWAMLAAGTDDVLATGMEILIVDEQWRIRVDYQLRAPHTHTPIVCITEVGERTRAMERAQRARARARRRGRHGGGGGALLFVQDPSLR